MTESDDLSLLAEKPFSEAVEHFEELLTQSGRAFLIGAGCSKCAGLPLIAELTEKVLSSDRLDTTTKEVLAAIQSCFETSSDANIEDYLSELIDMLAIADRRVSRGVDDVNVLVGESAYSAQQLRSAVDQIKIGIAEIFDTKVVIDTHHSFVKAVHRPLRQGKPRVGDRVDYLVLNYDTLLEDALALHQVPYADGIDGGVTGWWNPATFDREGVAARVFKLHGSVDWCELPGDPLPRRISPSLEIDSSAARNVLIWPASTKYRETQFDPFAQIADKARQVLRPGQDSQRVLVVCGYRFGDSHINLELDRALRESAGELTIIAFTAEESPQGQLKAWHEDELVSDRLLVFARRGFFHADKTSPSEVDLPWWKFENITRLLGGER